MAQTATHQRLELPILPERKGKNWLVRLADAMWSLKIAKDNIEEQWESARASALEQGVGEFEGDKCRVIIAEVTTTRLDTAKVEQYILSQGLDIKEFQKPTSSLRLTLKPLA